MNGVYRVAKKPHICSLCELQIPTGERYWYARITPWDHPDNEGYGTFRAHAACEELWKRIGMDVDWEFPNDPEWWTEQLAKYSSASPAD